MGIYVERTKIMDIKQDFRVYCSTNFKELNKSLIEDAFEKNSLHRIDIML